MNGLEKIIEECKDFYELDTRTYPKDLQPDTNLDTGTDRYTQLINERDQKEK